MLWGCIFVCFGLVGIGFAPSYLALFGIWVFVQVNFNIGNGPYQALIRDLVPAGRIGVASSIKVLSDASGSLVLVAVSSALISREAGPGPVDWQWLTLGILAFVLVTTTGITSLTVRSRETVMAVGQGVASALQPPAPGLHPQLSRFVLSRLLMMTAITAFPTFGLFYFEDVVGLKNPAEAVGRMALVIGGAVAISIYPAGWLSDRIGRKPVVMAGALGAAASTIWLLWADDAMDVMVIASFLGASVGVLLSSNWALANDLGTTGREGLHMGIVNLATTGGAALSRLMGPGIDLINRISEGAGYSALLITCGLLFVVGALILMPLRQNARNALSSYPRGMR
jgi:MFS-type transporter involved in bile tolerance (Atg22 family)